MTGQSNFLSGLCMPGSLSSIYVAIERNDERYPEIRIPSLEEAFSSTLLRPISSGASAKTNFEAGKIEFGTFCRVHEFLKKKTNKKREKIES